MSFKCFKHPNKAVQAVCTEPFCTYYRFFCVTCFLEQSPHFTNHKPSILEIQDVLSNHQNSLFKNQGIIDADAYLNNIQKLMQEYESLVKHKKSNFLSIIKDMEQKFMECKDKCIQEIEDYLQVLVQKQYAHFNYIKKKIELYKQEVTTQDWKNIHKHSEQEITYFFEKIIKSPITNLKEFKQEIKMYSASFQRNISELDSVNNQKILRTYQEEMNTLLYERFNQLKEILVMPIDENQFQSKMMINKEKMMYESNYNYNNNINKLDSSFTSDRIQNNYHNNEMEEYTLANNQTLGNNSFKNDLFNGNPNIFSKKSLVIEKPFYEKRDQPSEIELEQETLQYKSKKSKKLYNSLIQLQNGFQAQGNNYPKQQSSIFGNLTNSNILNDSCCQLNGAPNQQQHIQMQQHQTILPHQQQYLNSNINQTPSPTNQSMPHMSGITCIILFDEVQGKKQLATGSIDNSIKLWSLDKNNFELLKTMPGSDSAIQTLEKFQKEGTTFIAAGTANNEIKIWNPALSNGNELVTTLKGHQLNILSIKFLDDYLISGGLDKTIKVWDLNKLVCVLTQNQDEAVNCLCVYEQITGYMLVSACGDGFRILNYNGEGQFKLKSYNNKAHKKGISYIIAVGHNGIDLATAGFDGLIKLWNIDKGICIDQLKGHSSQVYKMLFNTTKGFLFSASCDGTIKVWEQQECIKQLQSDHMFTQDSEAKGDFVVLEDYSCILSVANGNNFIKIIPLQLNYQ